ncbi:MAG TPA: hypothetical protein VI111_09385 [Thermoleophilaceae bacterium]
MSHSRTPSPLRALTPREASIFACVCDTVIAPEPSLPPVRETDAVLAFDRMLASSPRLNRVALRALLHVAELAPRAVSGARLRALGSEQRARLLARVESMRSPQLRQLLTLVKSVACINYYGDRAVSLQLGYDADAVIARARALRSAEARP